MRRSQDMTEYVEIRVPIDTEEEKLNELHGMMLAFVSNNSRTLRSSCSMDIMEMGTTNLMIVRFSLDHKGNWQNGKRRNTTRTSFLLQLKKHLVELGITFELPNQRVTLTNSS